MRYIRLMRNISNWWVYLLVKYGLSRQDPILFRTRNAVLVEVPWRLLHTFKEIFMEECYMHGVGAPLPDRPVIIDIGANAGYFTLFAAARFSSATILSFEPIPKNYRLLEQNVRANPGCRILPLQLAVAAESGEAIMSFDEEDSVSTAAHIVTQDAFLHQTGTIKVPCTTLAEIFDRHHLDRCDFMKIDCEGTEYEILYCCPPQTLAKIRQMAIEVHSGPSPENQPESLKAYLRSQGFETYETSRALGMLWARRNEERQAR